MGHQARAQLCSTVGPARHNGSPELLREVQVPPISGQLRYVALERFRESVCGALSDQCTYARRYRGADEAREHPPTSLARDMDEPPLVAL